MFDPMFARLAGCLVFAGLLAALVTAADASRSTGAEAPGARFAMGHQAITNP